MEVYRCVVFWVRELGDILWLMSSSCCRSACSSAANGMKCSCQNWGRSISGSAAMLLITAIPLFCNFIYPPHKIDNFRHVLPYLGVVPATEALNIDQPSMTVSLSSQVTEIGVFLYFSIVVILQVFDLRISADIVRHCNEIGVLDFGDLFTCGS